MDNSLDMTERLKTVVKWRIVRCNFLVPCIENGGKAQGYSQKYLVNKMMKQDFKSNGWISSVLGVGQRHFLTSVSTIILDAVDINKESLLK